MSELNKEQIKLLSEHFNLTEDEVIQNADKLKDTIVHQFHEVREAVIRYWEQLKPELHKAVIFYKQYRRIHNQKFYRKKKSQRKNWSKWKKR